MRWLFGIAAILVLISPIAAAAQTQHAFAVYNYVDSWSYEYPYYLSGGISGFLDNADLLASNTSAIVPHLHADAYSSPSYDPSQNQLYFDVDRMATIPFVSTAWAQPNFMTLSEYLYSVSFDWSATIGSGFRLELQSFSPAGNEYAWQTIWSVVPSAVNHSGHVSTGFYGNGSRFVLTAVPEPSSILAILCGASGLGGLVWRRKR